MDNTNDKSKQIVKLSVGGVYYEVSRSLIEGFPETMLARLVSDTWQDDPEKTIFIERDGENFRHILTYMRDNQVHLPISVSKAAILKDLEYFGFQNVSCKDILDGRAVLEAAIMVARIQAEATAEIQMMRQKAFHLQIADYCFKLYLERGNLPYHLTFHKHDLERNSSEELDEGYLWNTDKDIMNQCLAKYGMKQTLFTCVVGDRWEIILDRMDDI